MQNNVLATRIYDFLKEYQPFSFIEKPRLLQLASSTKVLFFEREEVIFEKGEEAKEYFMVVHKGSVRLVAEVGSERILLDQLDQGDIFGLRPWIAKQPVRSTAIAREDTLIYALDSALFKSIFDTNPRVSSFFATAFATGRQTVDSNNNDTNVEYQINHIQGNALISSDIQTIEIKREPVTCRINTNIQTAAAIMSEQKVGSIVVVDWNYHPIGIITDSDLRRKVATGNHDIKEGVQEIMSQPPRCMSVESSYTQAQITMLKLRVNHLILTDDGTIHSPVKGVLSEHDLLMLRGNSPVLLVKESRQATKFDELRLIRDRADLLLQAYLEREVSIDFVSQIMTNITDTIFQRTIALAIQKLKDEQGIVQPTKFAFMAIGSHGREEQLIRSDQDNFLVFDDVPEQQYEEVKQYFLALSALVNNELDTIGYDKCTAGMMASNPKWCLALQEWKEQYENWIRTPNQDSILFSSIFLDFRAIYGELDFAEQLSKHIFETIEDFELFMTFMAAESTKTPPPLSFFKNFIVEKNGDHKQLFDIKLRGMLPLVNIARVLTLDHRIIGVNNTISRYRTLAEIDTPNKQQYLEAAEAYEILMQLRAVQGVANRNSGRYFDPSNLNKFQKLLLKKSFDPISSFQDSLNIRYNLKMFS